MTCVDVFGIVQLNEICYGSYLTMKLMAWFKITPAYAISLILSNEFLLLNENLGYGMVNL